MMLIYRKEDVLNPFVEAGSPSSRIMDSTLTRVRESLLQNYVLDSDQGKGVPPTELWTGL